MTHASAFTEAFIPLAVITVACAVLAGLALAMGEASVEPRRRRRIFTLTAIGAASWYTGISCLAQSGVFTASADDRFPLLPVAVFLPVILSLAALARSSFAVRLLDATPLPWLIGVQVLRVIGVVFLIEWAIGSLPSVFAVPAALGDIAVGLLAIPLARSVARRAPLAPLGVALWSSMGLLDFACALATGFLSSPGRFQILALDHPNLLASAYPLVMIPAFGVPIFMVLHILALWKLRRETLRTGFPHPVSRPA